MKKDHNMKKIDISKIKGIKIGQTQDEKAGTGCTVFISETGMCAGLDVRGGGPASRETPLLNPLMSAQFIHAIVLAGGSAYGLGAANGVMDHLAEQGIGLPVGEARVPLVVQSDIFDLTVGDMNRHPDAAMGYEAAKYATEAPNYRDGNYGAGTGATVGKIMGMDTCMKTGIGSYAVQAGELQVGAVVVLNAFGDIFDWKTGEKVAGLLNKDRSGFESTVDVMFKGNDTSDAVKKIVSNTTLGVIMTNAEFDKMHLCKIAGMAHNGYARSIRPVHTSLDGDSIYAVSLGRIRTDVDTVGTLAAMAMSEAILNAVYNADSAYGIVAAKDLSRS